jgi:hypothetical protein
MRTPIHSALFGARFAGFSGAACLRISLMRSVSRKVELYIVASRLARAQLDGDGILDVLGPSIVADIDYSIKTGIAGGADDPGVIARHVVETIRSR